MTADLFSARFTFRLSLPGKQVSRLTMAAKTQRLSASQRLLVCIVSFGMICTPSLPLIQVLTVMTSHVTNDHDNFP